VAKISDYKITSFYSSLNPTVEKFQIIHGGKQYSVYKTIEAAERIVSSLVKDSWFFERGYGQKFVEVNEFGSYEDAKLFQIDFNKTNTALVTPEWYMVARDPEFDSTEIEE